MKIGHQGKTAGEIKLAKWILSCLVTKNQKSFKDSLVWRVTIKDICNQEEVKIEYDNPDPDEVIEIMGEMVNG